MAIERNDAVTIVKGAYAGRTGVADKVYMTLVVVDISDGPLVELPKDFVQALAA